MNALLRVIAEKAVRASENIQEKIAGLRGIYTLRVPILMYHHINSIVAKNDKPKLYVDERLFEKEMKYLADNGYSTITLDDLTGALINKKSLPKKSIILTFDDGNLDFYRKAFPVLKKYKLKAAIFVVTNWINKPNCLTEDMLRNMLKSSLIYIGSHTVNHPDLTKLPTTKVTYELLESKKHLQNILDIKVKSFAYPFGKCSKDIISTLMKLGYSNALTTEYGGLHEADKKYQLKRIRLSNKILLPEFRRRITI